MYWSVLGFIAFYCHYTMKLNAVKVVCTAQYLLHIAVCIAIVNNRKKVWCNMKVLECRRVLECIRVF